MATLTDSSSQTDSSQQDNSNLKVTDILGVAIFDINGLPREYFVTEGDPSTSWVQIVFQALGLRSLLTSSLKLEGFHQISICLKDTTIVVVRRRYDYIALQFKGVLALTDEAKNNDFKALVNTLDVAKLQEHPHFKGT
ncbi:MAG: hypothetical protein F6K42_23260 [Leptolyngbya sp. SIO1D8]|nr:hypothetical protein [Leptolyngbya sp. SIO1D8]